MVSSRIHRKGSGLKVCYTGCSLTYGNELEPGQCYTELLDQHFNFKSTNLASNGNSNLGIFHDAIHASQQDYDIIFVQWTKLFRLSVYPVAGHKQNLTLVPHNGPQHDSEYHNFIFTKSMKSKLIDLYSVTNCAYGMLKDFMQMVYALQQMDKRFVFFSGLLQKYWNTDLEQPIPKQLLDFKPHTRDMLEFEHNSDDKILSLWHELQYKYQQLDKSRWIHMFPSIDEYNVDFAGTHPGPKTQRIFYENFKSYCEKKI